MDGGFKLDTSLITDSVPNNFPVLKHIFSMQKLERKFADEGKTEIVKALQEKTDKYIVENLPLMIVELEKSGHFIEGEMADGKKFIICATDIMAAQLWQERDIPAFSLRELFDLWQDKETFAAMFNAKAIFGGIVADENLPEHQPANQTQIFLPRAISKEARLEMASIRLAISKCQDCKLHETRINTVAGEGYIAPHIVFVAEAPGRTEDETGRPLVGKAGQLFDEALKNAGLERDKCYILNILKCRPPENRKPEPGEIQACYKHLLRQIAALSPTLIVPMGATAYGVFFPYARDSITKAAGKVRIAFVNGKNIAVFPTIHPAAALRGKSSNTSFNMDIGLIPGVLSKLLKDAEHVSKKEAEVQ